jgi:beta-carotene 3-hydroxylase
MYEFLIVLATFIIMEGVTWCTHKYIMHGLLWVWHYDHHNKNPKRFLEKNDNFFIVFAVISMTLFMLGSYYVNLRFLFFIGMGILAYGTAYTLVHEIIIHQRFRFFTNSHNFYFTALRRAHKNHHKKLGKEDGECYGMLWVPFHYFKNAWNESK